MKNKRIFVKFICIKDRQFKLDNIKGIRRTVSGSIYIF